jgi:hypothetical protein
MAEVGASLSFAEVCEVAMGARRSTFYVMIGRAVAH